MPTQRLRPQLGVFGATMMGLGSIVGTGVFVSIGIAAGIAGPSVVLAVLIAALVAICNGLSSAQLAACHPVSGGTYEYGYRYLNSWLGFLAGWLFLIAKSASAATAALGFAGYCLLVSGGSQGLRVPLALAAVVVLTGVVLSGIQRSNLANIVIVSITMFSLAFFVLAGLPQVSTAHFSPFFANAAGEPIALGAVLHASALMFVAYTGYGRIATLGEEVHEPRRTIPRAIIVTMLVTMVLYLAVASVGIGVVGAGTLSGAAQASAGMQPAPLAVAAKVFAIPFAAQILSIGAITAMLGVVLNLILGVSRVLLAMGRRQDMPSALARLNQAQSTPTLAVMMVGLIIAGLVLLGHVKTTWSFSAFTVLIYYALTNLAALRIPAAERLYPRWVALVGLLACTGLAFWVETMIWMIGLSLLGAGLIWHAVARRLVSQPQG
ncbi:MAG: amino acid permease [Candidatus Melainabacteria bacterium HGW-Melainabacteria-1]|nr:MAG: amino acid permease [Candidatus Melainabacteria bacterium HGW-Melainabacteria-1]